MKKIFKSAASDQIQNLGEQSFNATTEDSRVNTYNETYQKKQNDLLNRLTELNLYFKSSRENLNQNKTTLNELKQNSLADVSKISAEPCANISYLVKFVGLPQVEQYYDAVNDNYNLVLEAGKTMQELYNENKEELRKILGNVEKSLNQSATDTTNTDATTSASFFKKFFKTAQPAIGNTADDKKKQEDEKKALDNAVAQSLKQSVTNFLQFRVQLNNIEKEYQIFYTEYIIFKQTQNIAISFQSIMLDICSAKKQFDEDETQLGTGTRRDQMTILTMYPQAIALAKQYNQEIIKIIQYSKQVAPVQQSGIFKNTSDTQNKQTILDKRQNLLIKQMNYIVKQMKLDRRKYLFSPMESLFNKTK